MNQVFTHIATVSFQHEFFPESGFSGFDIRLSPDSASRFSNLQFHLKRYPTGFYVFSSSPESAMNEISPICFHINFKDSYFWNYTDLTSSTNVKKVLFLDHSLAEDSPYYMGVTTAVSSLQFIWGVKDNLNRISKEQPEVLQVKSRAGDEFDIAEVNRYSPGFLEEGLYEPVSTEDSFPFYFFNADSFISPDMVISFSPHLLYQRTLGGGSLTYSLQFTAKRTYWKYILMDKVYENFKGLNVIDLAPSAIDFSKSEIQISPTLKAPCFVSSQALPFSADGVRRFQLVDQGSATSTKRKIILKTLPHATATMLHAAQNESEFDSSHIFI